MNDRAAAALAVFSAKIEKQGVSLIDILARSAHTQFGLQRDDILPSEEEIDAYLAEYHPVEDLPEELAEGPETAEAVAVIDPAPPVAAVDPAPVA